MSEVQLALGEDLMAQTGLSEIKPDGTFSDSVKFDAKGSLHIMCRDADDKLVKDIPIQNQTESVTPMNMEEYFEKLDAMDRLKERKKNGILIAYMLLAVMATFMGVSIFVLLKLTGGI